MVSLSNHAVHSGIPGIRPHPSTGSGCWMLITYNVYSVWCGFDVVKTFRWNVLHCSRGPAGLTLRTNHGLFAWGCDQQTQQ